MKRFILIFGLLFSSSLAFSQFQKLGKPDNYRYYPQSQDTVVIDFRNGERMKVTSCWFQLFSDSDKSLLDFDQMFSELELAVETLKLDQEKYHLLFRYRLPLITSSKESTGRITGNVSVLEVRRRIESEETKSYKLENGKISAKLKWQNLIEFDFPEMHWNVKFWVNDLNDMSSIRQNYRELFKAQSQTFNEQKFYKENRKYFYELSDGKMQYHYSQFIGKRAPFFALHLYPMVGTSITKGKLSTDMGLMLGASFNDHQSGNVRLGIRYQLKGFGSETPGKIAMQYNGFTDAVMDLNVGRNSWKQNWVGAGLGYLVHRSGDVYGKNTARLFLNYRSSKLLGIQPEFNYSFDDHKGFIALGLYLGW